MTGRTELPRSPPGPARAKGSSRSTLCLSRERARHARGLPATGMALRCSSDPLPSETKLEALTQSLKKTRKLSQLAATSDFSDRFQVP